MSKNSENLFDGKAAEQLKQPLHDQQTVLMLKSHCSGASSFYVSVLSLSHWGVFHSLRLSETPESLFLELKLGAGLIAQAISAGFGWEQALQNI